MIPERVDNPAGSNEHRWPSYQPMVLVVLAFGLGILLDRALDLSWYWSFALAWASLFGWFVVSRIFVKRDQSVSYDTGSRARIASVLLLIGLVFAGAFWHHGRWNWFSESEIGRFASDVAAPCCVDATVISEPRWMVGNDSFGEDGAEDTVRTRLTLQVNRIRDGSDWKRATGITDLVIHTPTEHVNSGDDIRVFGRLVASTPPNNPGQFDFQKFYRAKRRLAFLHAYEIESVEVLKPADWLGRATAFDVTTAAKCDDLEVRRRPGSRFCIRNYAWESRSVIEIASGIFSGNGDGSLAGDFGLHVGILASSFFLFFRFGLLSRRKCLWATILFVIFYAWLVEFRPPVSRAAILVTLFCIGRLLGENSFSFNLLAIAGWIVLLINPSDLFGLGPQLSFLAVATLTFGREWVFWPPPKDPIKRLIASTRPAHVRSLNWMGRQLRTAILVSGLIWIVAMPLVAFRFHLVAPVALVVNPLLLVPIAWGLYGALGVLVFGWFLSPAARIFGWFCECNLALIEWMIGAAQAVPLSHFWTAGPPRWSLLVFYVGVFLFAVYPPSRLPGRWIAVLAAVWLVFGWLIPDQFTKFMDRRSENPLVCTFVDVGHGSGVLIQLPDGRNILYDAGSFGAADYGARSVAGVLWSQRIEHLDAVVLSHADVDHFNAIPILAEKFSIGVVYVSPQMFASESSAVRQVFETLEHFEVPVKLISAGDKLLAGQETHLNVLGPPVNGCGGNDNSNSVVLSVEHQGSKVLLPGDLEQSGLLRLLELAPIDFDLVMAPHHGSKNSLPHEFMKWATPEFVVISGGSQRVSDRTVAMFEPSVREVARTDVDGAIRFSVDKQGVRLERWKTQPW